MGKESISPTFLIPFVKFIGSLIHESTPFYSLESNGVLEGKNKILKDTMNTMLVSSRTPMNL